MFIKNFGQFWHSDEVAWNPGQGVRNACRLLGRQYINLPGLRLADFRHQQGIYILYSNHGPYYTGLTLKQGFGKRLLDHHGDRHAGKWDRFSWFGFKKVLAGTDQHGICKLGKLAEIAVGEPSAMIRDVEALLIRALGTSNNVAQTRFREADEWVQVKAHEAEDFLEKVA
jgi:hypothetical protein